MFSSERVNFQILDQSENCNQLSFLSLPQGNKTAVIGN